MLNIYLGTTNILTKIHLFDKNSINRIRLLTMIKKKVKVTRMENSPIYKVKTPESFEILQ